MAQVYDDLGDFNHSCPLANRRTTRELYVKLFVVHFIVISAYVGLLLRRNEPWVAFRSLIVGLVPISPLSYFVAPIAALITTALCSVFDKTACTAALRVLFGRLDDTPAQELPRHDAGASEERSFKNVAGPLVLQFVLIAQCCMSIFLFGRRSSRDALDLVDYRVLYLAISGLCIGLLSIIHIFTVPTFPEPSSRIHNKGWYRGLAGLRWIQSGKDHVRSPEQNWFIIIRDFCGATFACALAALILYAATPMAKRDDLIVLLWPMKPMEVTRVLETRLVLSVAAMATLAVLKLLLICPASGAINEKILLPVFRVGLFQPLPLFLYVMLLISTTPFLAGFELYSTMLGIAKLSTLPPDLPCPQAWKDPMADYLWWLA